MNKELEIKIIDLNTAIYNYITSAVALQLGRKLNSDPTTWPSEMDMVNHNKKIQTCIEELVTECHNNIW